MKKVYLRLSLVALLFLTAQITHSQDFDFACFGVGSGVSGDYESRGNDCGEFSSTWNNKYRQQSFYKDENYWMDSPVKTIGINAIIVYKNLSDPGNFVPSQDAIFRPWFQSKLNWVADDVSAQNSNPSDPIFSECGSCHGGEINIRYVLNDVKYVQSESIVHLNYPSSSPNYENPATFSNAEELNPDSFINVFLLREYPAPLDNLNGGWANSGGSFGLGPIGTKVNVFMAGGAIRAWNREQINATDDLVLVAVL